MLSVDEILGLHTGGVQDCFVFKILLAVFNIRLYKCWVI